MPIEIKRGSEIWYFFPVQNLKKLISC